MSTEPPLVSLRYVPPIVTRPVGWVESVLTHITLSESFLLSRLSNANQQTESDFNFSNKTIENSKTQVEHYELSNICKVNIDNSLFLKYSTSIAISRNSEKDRECTYQHEQHSWYNLCGITPLMDKHVHHLFILNYHIIPHSAQCNKEVIYISIRAIVELYCNG